MQTFYLTALFLSPLTCQVMESWSHLQAAWHCYCTALLKLASWAPWCTTAIAAIRNRLVCGQLCLHELCIDWDALRQTQFFWSFVTDHVFYASCLSHTSLLDFFQLIAVEDLSPKQESSPAPVWIVLDGRITSLILRVFLLLLYTVCFLPLS